MSLALSLSLNIGYKKTMFMILGGVFGLGFVSLVCAVGVGALIITKPEIFEILKVVGGIYILFLSYKMFMANSKFKDVKAVKPLSNLELFVQGFMTCNINPKAWIFLATLLPPFLDRENPINLKMFILIFIIMLIEFLSYNTYALGGLAFKKLMSKHVQVVEKISAFLMGVIGIWIIFE